MNELSHLDQAGNARMVDVSEKSKTLRQAWAQGQITLSPEAFSKLKSGVLSKGDALVVAKIAGIQGAKQTSNLIPLCHPIRVDFVDVEFTWKDKQCCLTWMATTKSHETTGIEMEALTCSAIVGLTIHDMVKAVDPWCTISNISLVRKTGGKSGDMNKPS